MTILKSNPIIFYSSIGSLHSRPDLVERTVTIELQRIPDDERKDEPELLAEFNDAVPVILGGIFDVLANAVRAYQYHEISGLPRMAEYARWGCVIAEQLGATSSQFLIDYAQNSGLQTEELIERDTLFSAVVEAMSQPGRETLSGSFHEIILALSELACPGQAANGYSSLAKDKTFPSARGFRKHIERIRMPLEHLGISFTIQTKRTSNARAFVTIKKMKEVYKTDDSTVLF